jgi:FtsP/CotA-like multicopper oxidase with cupredoxin domain
MILNSADKLHLRYHAHSDFQRSDGLYGGFVVHEPFKHGLSESEKYGYDKEQLLLIGDWYHRSAEEVLANYLTFRSSENEVLYLLNGSGHGRD